MSGANLFLIDSIASDPQFTHVVPVPRGFIESNLSVPRPDNGPLYLKLRDDPSAVDTTAIPIVPGP